MKLLLFLALVGLASSLHATTFYVNASGGSNSNACTVITSPCLTITGGIGKGTAAGSIIQVAPGTYNESIVMNNSGTSGNPITIRGQDGTGCPVTPVTDVNNPTGNRPNSGVIVNGSFEFNGVSWVNLDCMFFNGTSAGINIEVTTSNFQITNNVIMGTTSLTTNAGGMFFQGVGTTQSTSYSNNGLIQHNFITQSTGIFGACSSCTFSENEIFNLQGSEVNSGNMNDHDYIDPWGNGVVIRHNYMHGNTCNSCNGLDCHMDCVQAFNTSGDGTEVSKNVTIDRNVCFNHHEGVIVQDNGGNGDISNWTVTNNVFGYGPYDDGSGHLCVAGTAHPWCWIFEDGLLGTSNTFYNNTCLDGTMGFRQGSPAKSIAASFKDNVYYSFGSTTTIYDTSGATVTGANNLDFATSGTFGGGTFTGDIINQNPLFVTIGTGSGTQQCIGCNFNVQSTSPVKNAGVSTSPTVTVDLLGTARPQGTNYDIGAYELILGSTGGSSVKPGVNLTAGVVIK